MKQMLGINDINMLAAQNEGYREQNKHLQQENINLRNAYKELEKKYNELSKNDLVKKLNELKTECKVERIRNRNLMKRLYRNNLL